MVSLTNKICVVCDLFTLDIFIYLIVSDMIFYLLPSYSRLSDNTESYFLCIKPYTKFAAESTGKAWDPASHTKLGDFEMTIDNVRN